MSNLEIDELRSLVSVLSSKVSSLEANQDLIRQLGNKGGATDIVNLDTGDTAWMLCATALVLFMTVPGLGLYYAGITRSKNVLTTFMQCFTITCLITFLWLCFGYSLSFGPALPQPIGQPANPVIGDGSRLWLQGLRENTYHQLAPTIPEAIFCAYQLTFAIITPSLIVGSFADRMKHGSMIVFITLWHLIVYCPIAHSVWHPSGFLFKAGSLDYAGGNVVHISSGISGLVSTLVLGRRHGFPQNDFERHNILLTAMGASMLWVGWFGFNAGSAVGANERAAMALLCTQIATAIASLGWMCSEWYVRKYPSVLGMVSGAVAGLVAITPASGFVDPTGAFFIGLFAGPVCYFSSQLKFKLQYDDALDSFGVHAVGGILGGILTGFFATSDIGGGTLNGVFYANTEIGGGQLGKQLYAIVVTIGYAAFVTFLILKSIDLTMGLRVTEKDELEGLDHALYKENISEAVAESVQQYKASVLLQAESVEEGVPSVELTPRSDVIHKP